jgi:hypothetical protein
MGRPKRKQPPRVHPGPDGISLTIHVTDSATERGSELEFIERVYDLGGKIAARRQASVEDFNDIAAKYTYEGNALPDVWPKWDGTKSDNAVTEMVAAARALAYLGYREAHLTPRKPPNPDLFAETIESGKIAIEVTLALDEGEQQFQRSREEFQHYLNACASGRKLDRLHVSIGFTSIPAPKHYERVAQAILEDVDSHTGTRMYEPEGVLAEYISQIQILSAQAGKPIFSSAGVVNVRGHADLFEIAMQRVNEKRDLMDYETEGRDLWLVVGIQLPVIGPDVMRALYETDLDLGPFSKVVFSQQGDLVTFTRQR